MKTVRVIIMWNFWSVTFIQQSILSEIICIANQTLRYHPFPCWGNFCLNSCNKLRSAQVISALCDTQADSLPPFSSSLCVREVYWSWEYQIVFLQGPVWSYRLRMRKKEMDGERGSSKSGFALWGRRNRVLTAVSYSVSLHGDKADKCHIFSTLCVTHCP